MTDVWAVGLAYACGLALSASIERWLTPQPPWRRPLGSWAIQAGVFGLLHGALVLLLGRPWFAAAVVCALMLVVVVVNNAKVRALREPFVFADYEYFTDAIRHPRLFVPFLGWGNALAIAVGVVAALTLGLRVESAPAQRWALSGQLGALLGLIAVSVLCLAAGARQALLQLHPPLPVCPRAAQEYGCNILNLGNERVISVHMETARQIVQSPYFTGDVQCIDYSPITSMYGAVHCSSQVVKRTPRRF